MLSVPSISARGGHRITKSRSRGKTSWLHTTGNFDIKIVFFFFRTIGCLFFLHVTLRGLKKMTGNILTDKHLKHQTCFKSKNAHWEHQEKSWLGCFKLKTWKSRIQQLEHQHKKYTFWWGKKLSDVLTVCPFEGNKWKLNNHPPSHTSQEISGIRLKTWFVQHMSHTFCSARSTLHSPAFWTV